MKNRYISELQQKFGTLIGAHRGTHGGNVIQNTCLAYELSLKHGAHIIECDTIKTADGFFYAFHNGYEKEVLGTDTDIRTMTSKEIDAVFCLNELGQRSNQKLERLDTILPRFKDRCIINVDRSWFYWEETISFLKRFSMDEQILLKSPPEKEFLKTLEKSGSRISYMPIVKKEEDLETVFSFDIYCAAVEIVFDDKKSPLISSEALRGLKEKGLFTWANAINLGGDYVLSAGYDDDVSLARGPEYGWGKLIDLGFDMIQTDWPYPLREYILGRNS